ncbi:MAG: 50S ribosomal protein L17 [uncultured bacterium]|nr:MAG: 50S ribosomal protein L17 [uncultured bacterium]
MRHQVAGRKLGRTTAHRLAMFRNMLASLIQHGRIKTTLPRAKELRSLADKIVTLGKENTLHARRRAFDFLRDRKAVVRLFNDIAPAFSGRMGGYTRIYQLGSRVGDAAKMAMIEFLQEDLLAAKVAGNIVDDKAKKKAGKKAATQKEDVATGTVKEAGEAKEKTKVVKTKKTAEKKENKTKKSSTKTKE